MLSMIIGTKKGIQGHINNLEGMMRSCSSYPRIVQIALFVVASFARIGFEIWNFIVSIPIFLFFSPQQSFEKLARRNESGAFLDSYTSHVKRYRWVVATSLSAILAVGVQLSIFGLVIYRAAKPAPVQAYSGSVTLYPAYDATGSAHVVSQPDGFDGCSITETPSCQSDTSTLLRVGHQLLVALDCTSDTVVEDPNNAVMRFNLSSIPAGSTITSVQLNFNVQAIAGNMSIGRPVDDFVESHHADCTTPGSSFFDYSDHLAQQYIFSTNIASTGAKSVTLGSTANSDVQARIGGNIAIALVGFPAGNGPGAIYSTDSATNKPNLVVTYTHVPQAPTGFTKSSITTSSIVWNWTDNATVETAYNIKNGTSGGSAVTGCSGLAANSTSCTETGLSANTQYTRHPSVTDAQGTTEGSSASAYTAIETPSGVVMDSVSEASVTVHAGGTLSNLGQGQSALYFNDTTTNVNSGWVTTNSWTESGLNANTTYQIEVKARNGDGVETSYTAVQNVITLAPMPGVTPTLSESTWSRTAGISFTNSVGWGNADPQGVAYYRYVWDQSLTHAFSGAESTWNSNFDGCPGDECTVMNVQLDLTMNAEGQWYLHLQSMNAANQPTGSGMTFGPFGYDHTAPTAVATVTDGSGTDLVYTSNTAQLSAHWTAATDSVSGVATYQYAIGTTAGDTDVKTWTDTTSTSVTVSSLSLSNDGHYYVSVRAVDGAGNVAAATSSNGVIVDTDLPPSPTPVTINNAHTTPSKYYLTDTDTLQIEWSPVSDEAGITAYQYAVGTAPGTDDVIQYTNDGVGTMHTEDNPDLNEGGQYYVSVRAVDVAGNVSTPAVSNPVVVDTTAPTAPSVVVDGTGADAQYATSLTQLSAHWTAATDSVSGVAKYQYAIGTTAGGTQVGNWTDVATTMLTATGLSLTDGATYYVSVRAVDNASNVGAASTSNGVTVNTSLPQIMNNQATATVVPIATAGTTYDVDFEKSSIGPNLAHAEYAVYTGSNKTGALVKDWTSIFSTATASYTSDWQVDFASLAEGTNYVSVRVTGLDALVNELDDAFTIEKDSLAPQITGVTTSVTMTSLTVSWTTSEPATGYVEYGLTSAYGSTTRHETALATSHQATVSNLTAGMTYHFRIYAYDAAHNVSVSNDADVSLSASSIHDVRVIAGETIVTFFWTTDNAASSSVTCGTRTVTSSTSVLSHRVSVSGLKAGTTYVCSIVSGSDSASVTVTMNTPESTKHRAVGPTILEPTIRPSSSTLTLTGVARGDQTIRVFVDGKVVKKVRTAGSGSETTSFSIDVSLATLKPGSHVVYLQSTDANGRTSMVRQRVTLTTKAGGTGAAVSKTTGSSLTYTVKKGDSLWLIAQRYLGDGAQYTRIIAANPSLAAHPSFLRQGFVLKLPRG